MSTAQPTIKHGEWFCEGQLALFAGTGFTFFRELEPGDHFALGTPQSHSAGFEVESVNHRHGIVTCKYVNRNGETVTGYDWRYNVNDSCVLLGGKGEGA